jgi:hypothetical protein
MSSRENDMRISNAQPQPNGSYLNKRGMVTWYNHIGQRHKEDGPAVIWSNGNTYWYINGNEYTLKEYLKLSPITDEQKLLLRLQYA